MTGVAAYQSQIPRAGGTGFQRVHVILMQIMKELEMNTIYRQIDDLPLSLRVDELMVVLDIGRNTAYTMLRSGLIRSVRIGRQIRIPRDALIEFLQGETKPTGLH